MEERGDRGRTERVRAAEEREGRALQGDVEARYHLCAMAKEYSRDEVQAVIARALKQSAHVERISHDELLSIGAELGIDPAAMEAAASSAREDAELAAAREELRRKGRRGLVGHAIPFVMVNLALLITNLIAGGAPWFLFCLFGWGIGMVFHAKAAFWPDPATLDRRAHERVARSRERVEREAQKRAAKESAKRLGHAVEEAVPEILGAVAKMVDVAVAESRAKNATQGTRVRVDAPPEEREAPPEERESSSHQGDARARSRRG